LSEHSLQSPGFGYMFRTVTFSSVQDIAPNLALESFDEVVEGDDDHATLPQSQSASLNSTQYVVYSATFQVPAFYFTIHDSCAWACTMSHARSEDEFQMGHRSP
jgi:ubiquitin-like-conjugating enzyme ATG10